MRKAEEQERLERIRAQEDASVCYFISKFNTIISFLLLLSSITTILTNMRLYYVP